MSALVAMGRHDEALVHSKVLAKDWSRDHNAHYRLAVTRGAGILNTRNSSCVFKAFNFVINKYTQRSGQTHEVRCEACDFGLHDRTFLHADGTLCHSVFFNPAQVECQGRRAAGRGGARGGAGGGTP